jgi:hypothetical protein
MIQLRMVWCELTGDAPGELPSLQRRIRADPSGRVKRTMHVQVSQAAIPRENK